MSDGSVSVSKDVSVVINPINDAPSVTIPSESDVSIDVLIDALYRYDADLSSVGAYFSGTPSDQNSFEDYLYIGVDPTASAFNSPDPGDDSMNLMFHWVKYQN